MTLFSAFSASFVFCFVHLDCIKTRFRCCEYLNFFFSLCHKVVSTSIVLVLSVYMYLSHC